MAKGGKLNQRKIHAAGNNQQEEILALKREVAVKTASENALKSLVSVRRLNESDELVVRGVSETLCMVLSPRGWNGSFVEPLRVEDSELVSCGNPFSDAASGLLEISDGQID
jgi:hypothetical protein